MASSSSSAYKNDDRAKDNSESWREPPPRRRSRSPQQGSEKKYGGSRDNDKDRRNVSDRWSSRDAGPSRRPSDRNGKNGRDKDADWKSRKDRERDRARKWAKGDDFSKRRDKDSEERSARDRPGKNSLESRLEPRHESQRKTADDDEEDEETRQRRIERLKRRRRSAGFDSDDETVTLEDLIAARQKARDDDKEVQRKNDRIKDDGKNEKDGSRYDRRDRDDTKNNRNSKDKGRDRDRHSRDDDYNRFGDRRDRVKSKHENGKDRSPRTGNNHHNEDRSRGWDRDDDRQTSPVARILRRRVPSSSPHGREEGENHQENGNEVAEDTLMHSERTKEDSSSLAKRSAPSIPLRAGPDEVYDRVAQVGEGTYGQVFKAKSDKTGITVALKKIRMESERDGFPITALREVKLLQGLKHENVVRLHEMMLSKHSIYMVFEYLQHDLNGVLAQPSITFSPAHIKSLAAQLLSGLAYLHKHRILHRDLKCSNLLLNNEGTLKLADFGLARTYVKQSRPSARNKTLDYTNRVVTLWYRAPELLFGETSYDDAIDVWGAGCIFLELFLRKPIFQGSDEIHQVQLLFEILGPVSKDEWPEAERLPWFDIIRPQHNEEKGKSHKEHLRSLVGSDVQVPDDALEVALALLTYNPRKRVSASEGLELPYFTINSPPAEKPAALLQAVQGEWHEFESRKARRDAAAQALQDHVHREKEQQRIKNEQSQLSEKVTITPSTQEPVQDITMSSTVTPTMMIDEALQRKEEREVSA
ncbi:hypothetical protein L7F22_068177 [Adiantum nelumboides]|nr:hypothetical protein [Adiantum nelumboides]